MTVHVRVCMHVCVGYVRLYVGVVQALYVY